MGACHARPAAGRRYRRPLRRGLLHGSARRRTGATASGRPGWHVLFTTQRRRVRATSAGRPHQQNSSPMFREQLRGHLRFLAKHRGAEGGRARAHGCCWSSPALSARSALPAATRGRTYRERRALAAPPSPTIPSWAGGARVRAPRQLVVDVGWVNGLAAIRSLGRAGVPVDRGRPPAERALGFRSRYARPARLAGPAGRGGVRLVPGGTRARRAAPVLRHARRAAERDRTRRRAAGRSEFLYPFPPWERARPDPDQARPARGRASRGRSGAAHRLPGLVEEARCGGRELGYPGAGQAVLDGGLQAGDSGGRRFAARPAGRSRWPSPTPKPTSRSCRRSCPAATRSSSRSAATSPPTGRRWALFCRPQAPPDASGCGHVPGRRGGLGR